jgi:hypothetical protein
MTTSTDIKEPMTTGTSNVYVNYTILEVNYQAGPYKDVAEAFEHKKDIQSYAGVSRVYIFTGRDPSRTLIGEEPK